MIVHWSEATLFDFTSVIGIAFVTSMVTLSIYLITSFLAGFLKRWLLSFKNYRVQNCDNEGNNE